jgi:DNA-binding XRE family transcriptional regulator
MEEEISVAIQNDWLAQHSIFVFDNQSRIRLMMARMKLDMNQKALAEKLGCKQQTVSDIESGALKYTEKVTVYALQQALKVYWKFVVWGVGKSRFNPAQIKKEFWLTRYKTQGRKKNEN